MQMVTVQVPVADVPALTRVLTDAKRAADMAQEFLPRYRQTVEKWEGERQAATRLLEQLPAVTA